MQKFTRKEIPHDRFSASRATLRRGLAIRAHPAHRGSGTKMPLFDGMLERLVLRSSRELKSRLAEQSMRVRAVVPIETEETSTRDGSKSRNHLLTVVVEDYFHVAPLKSVVATEQWYRFERRVEENTHKALDLLDEYGVSATFFVLGSIADERPELIRTIVSRGHEVASKGYFHRSISRLSREEFRDELRRSKDAIEHAAGSPVRGFRIGHRWFGPGDLWALDVLAEEGFEYDSSLRPLFRRFSGQDWRRKPHVHTRDGHQIWEFPLASWSFAGWSLPISGGNYFRQLPDWMIRRAVDSWVNDSDEPFLMYFHVWELDPEQPRIHAAPFSQRVRQYRNLDRMEPILRSYLDRYNFMGIADFLGLPCQRSLAVDDTLERDESSAVHFVNARTPVSIVVPCFNEELILPYLANTLKSVERRIRPIYELTFIFVDDGSSDGTWESLQAIFGARDNCVLIRHPANRGVAAAILTGIQAAETEVVCSIDCDCTYDPHQLEKMIPLLDGDLDMVTASPYHSEGEVSNVPTWRLFLSKSLSSMYRFVLHHRLATYTSCFRVYRREAVAELPVREGGFLGVAETLGLLDLEGGRIMEFPARLEVRLLGRSKMKTLSTIVGHLGLLTRLAARRMTGAAETSD
jgi:polysaccharide deacetylase family protein (PEP-CTERM system associated)